MARNARKSGNAIEMLKADHRKVKALFEEYEAHQEPADRQRIAERAFQELEIHTQLEESIFYPAVEAKGNEDEKDLVAEALEEHAAIKELIAELREIDPSDEQYDEKFREMMDSVEHHVEEEENELFPEVMSHLGEEIEDLGEQMEDSKRQIQAEA